MKEINEKIICECGHSICDHELHYDGFIGALVGKCLDDKCDCSKFSEHV